MKTYLIIFVLTLLAGKVYSERITVSRVQMSPAEEESSIYLVTKYFDAEPTQGYHMIMLAGDIHPLVNKNGKELVLRMTNVISAGLYLRDGHHSNPVNILSQDINIHSELDKLSINGVVVDFRGDLHDLRDRVKKLLEAKEGYRATKVTREIKIRQRNHEDK